MDWTALAVNAPIIAVFVWYATEQGKLIQQMQSRYMDALDKRETEYERRNSAVCASLEMLAGQIAKLTERIVMHDEFSRTKLDSLEDKKRRSGDKRDE